MGRNYYLHLGKRSAAGGGKTTFAQAVSLTALRADANARGALVIDEYGQEQTLGEFFELVAVDALDTDSIGQQFS